MSLLSRLIVRGAVKMCCHPFRERARLCGPHPSRLALSRGADVDMMSGRLAPDGRTPGPASYGVRFQRHGAGLLTSFERDMILFSRLQFGRVRILQGRDIVTRLAVD